MPPPQLCYDKLPHHVHLRLAWETRLVLINEFLKRTHNGKKKKKKRLSSISQPERSAKPTYETLTEDGGLLVVEVAQTQSCHAAGGRALGASNASVSAAVLRGGRIGGNRLPFHS